MGAEIKTISSLEKVRSAQQEVERLSNHKIMLGGETFSYQQLIRVEERTVIKVRVESPIADCVHLYVVKNAAMDLPAYADRNDADYITKEPGLMPDILVPLEEQNNCMLITEYGVIWVEIRLSKGYPAGEYPVTLYYEGEECIKRQMMIEVLPLDLPKQELIFTQWFHTDCIASAHNVAIYSEEHWALIDKYMALAHELGMNMILTPTITPPLDTQPGTYRPNTQLVGIEKKKDGYVFEFSKLKRWIDLAHKNHITYFEMAHLFSQWGLQCCPGIYAGEERIFGWDMPATDPKYASFLKEFLPALVGFLEREGVKEQCVFHLSDEPQKAHLENYRYAHSIVKPLLGDIKIMDALSDEDFYEEGLVDIPVTASNHMDPFLKKQMENQWIYYCCGQNVDMSNRFLAMSSTRTRMMGLQMYKYHLKGFLQWGYNFYYSALSVHPINPYITTSSEQAFPSGDPFTVYPWKDGAIPSIRGKVFKEGLQDMQLLALLESRTSHEEVVAWMEEVAGMEITFAKYPKSEQFFVQFNDMIKEKLKG